MSQIALVLKPRWKDVMQNERKLSLEITLCQGDFYLSGKHFLE